MSFPGKKLPAFVCISDFGEDSHPLMILFILSHHHYCFFSNTVERERSTVCLTHGTFTTSVFNTSRDKKKKAELGRANPD